VIEVGVVVKDGCAVVFGGGGGEQVHYASGTVLASCDEKGLDPTRTGGDLVGARELYQLATHAEDPLVLARVAGRVAQIEVGLTSPVRR
jgi:hypothetical protein